MNDLGPAELFDQLPDMNTETDISDDATSRHSADDFSNFFGANDADDGFMLSASTRSTGLPEATIQDPLEQEPKTYNLRPGPREVFKQSSWITYLDNDESGTYDPANPHQQRPKLRELSLDCDDGDFACYDEEAAGGERAHRTQPRAAQLSRLAAKQKGISIVVTFELTTPALQDLASRIPDCWPGGVHNILSEEHCQKLCEEITTRNDFASKYNLRRRIFEDELDSRTPSGMLITPDDIIADPLIGQDNEPFELDLRWHPAARGCIRCRESNHDCSLLQDCQVWPCKECALDNFDCQLLVCPKTKAACMACRRKKVSCSYVAEGSNPKRPCTSCAARNQYCHAGPAQGAIRERISYDRDYVKERTAEALSEAARIRRSVQCTVCRQRKQRCSLRGRGDKPPCSFCQEHGHDCEFRPPKHVRKVREPVPTSSRSVEDPIVPLRSNSDGPKGSVRMRTSLIHPIAFLHEDEEECTWCNENIGILGRGDRELIVLPAADGLSYTEVHPEYDHGGEKMCVNCTMLRMRVLGCSEHEFRPLDGRILEKDHTTGMFSINMDHVDQLFCRLETKDFLASDKWCAICPAPALYQCCTPQETDMWGEPVNPLSSDAEGCGFLCCEDCSSYLMEFNGDLEKLIERVKKDESIWTIGARADVDLLKQDGLLVKNLTAGLGGGEEAMDLDE